MLSQLTLREMLSNLNQISREVSKMTQLIEDEIVYTKEEFEHALKKKDRMLAIRIYKHRNKCALTEARDEVDALMLVS